MKGLFENKIENSLENSIAICYHEEADDGKKVFPKKLSTVPGGLVRLRLFFFTLLIKPSHQIIMQECAKESRAINHG